jgi:geranylgeranyl pyrophosphate synthase
VSPTPPQNRPIPIQSPAPHPSRHFEDLAAQFETELRAFSRARAAQEGRPVQNLHDAMDYALGADLEDPKKRGKRIRPLLCLLTAEALGADRARAMPFALAIELMHNFALVHDDIEDGDVMRRGRDAAWIKYGLAHAVNVGDYLLVQTTSALLDWGTPALDVPTRFRLLKLIDAALEHTHIGQALDINFRARREFSESDYLRIVREKTGYYLAAPIQGGAIVAGADEATLARIQEMAHLLGPLFQIIDDIIDLTDGKGREATGSDIREGKRSYLVAWTAGRASPAERDRMFDILDKPREATTRRDIDIISKLFDRHGAIDAGRRYCQELYAQSLRVLATLPPALGAALGPVFESWANRNR